MLRLEKPYLNKKTKAIATNTPLEPVLKEVTRRENTKKNSNLVFCLSLKNKTANAIELNEANILGFQTTPLYLPDKILGANTKPMNIRRVTTYVM